jgi:hypothetical protein
LLVETEIDASVDAPKVPSRDGFKLTERLPELTVIESVLAVAVALAGFVFMTDEKPNASKRDSAQKSNRKSLVVER